VTIHGSTRVFPSLPLDVRGQRRMAVISCQCPSISLTISGSSSKETSKVLKTSPAAVIRYGSARSVRNNGRIARTATGCLIGSGLFTEVSEPPSGTTLTVSSAEACQKKGAYKVRCIHPLQKGINRNLSKVGHFHTQARLFSSYDDR